MNFPTYIARRYLFAKKSHNAINIISIVSVACIAVGTMALIIVLSVFNGFTDVIRAHFNVFDPDLKIEIAEGKTFIPDSTQLGKLKHIKGISAFSLTVEENVLLKYAERQYIATIKGVDSLYIKVNRVDTMIREGEFILKEKNSSYAVIGYGVAGELQVGLKYIHPIQIFVLNKYSSYSINPINDVTQSYIYPRGFFSIEQEIDTKYILVPLRYAQDLLGDTLSVSSIEVKIESEALLPEIQQHLKKIMGNKFTIKNRFEQKELYYRIMKYEKWAIFMILSFILLIASFNVIGSLAVLIIEKKKDIGILHSMGADSLTISRIFQFEGIMISVFGGMAGLVLGVAICLAQQIFGFIKLPANDNFIIEAYPIALRFTDIVGVILVVLAIGITASWFTVKFVIGKYLAENQISNQ